MANSHRIYIFSFDFVFKFIIAKAYCGLPPRVNDATVTGTGFHINDDQTYTCSAGHTMVGNAVITCLANSTWEQPPQCPGKVSIWIL